jgi:hypothetical protein
MSIHDRLTDRARQVALADGLGLLPPGLRSARGRLVVAAARDAQAKFDAIATARQGIDFALVSGRGMNDAKARLSAAVQQFDDAARALLAHRGGAAGGSQLGVPLAGLEQHLSEPHASGGNDEWDKAVRAALAQVAEAARLSEAAADAGLYNSDPQVQAACRQIAGLSRLGLVEQAVARPGTGLLSGLPRGTSVYGFAIGGADRKVTPLPLFAGGRPVKRLLLDPALNQPSDLAGAVRAALNEAGGAPVRAVVLFSDGRQATPSGRAPADGPPRTPAVGVPVYAVAASAAGTAVKDESLSHVTLPAAVYVGEPFTVRARVRGIGMPANSTVDVRCVVGGRQPPPPVAPGSPLAIAWELVRGAIEPALAEPPPHKVKLDNAQAADVEFRLRIDEPGSHPVTLWLSGIAGELTDENNAAERWVKVYPRKARVMLLAAAPTWDYRILRDTLASHPSFDARAMTLAGDTFPLTPREILEQDAIVLFDVPAAALGEPEWDAVHRLASERGGLVVLAAGANHLPSEYTAEPLASLLPVRVNAVPAAGSTGPSVSAEQMPEWRTWHGQEPVFHFTPADEESAARLAGGEGSVAADELRAWDTLPPLYRFLPLPHLLASARPLLKERESGEPVVAEMALGAGRVLFVGLDETWRWRFKAAEATDAMPQQMWLGLLKTSMEPAYAAVADGIALDVGRAAVAPGEPVAVRVKLSGSDGSPAASVAAATVELRVLRAEDDSVVHTQALAPLSVPGRYAGELTGLPPGRFTLEARAAAGRVARYPLNVIPRYGSELENPVGDPAALKRIADASEGGEPFSLEDVRRLTTRVNDLLSQPRPVTLGLWDSTYLFVFVIACFAAEWAIRKRVGLA